MRPGRKPTDVCRRVAGVGVIEEDVEDIPVVDAVYESAGVLDGPDFALFGHDAVLLAECKTFRKTIHAELEGFW